MSPIHNLGWRTDIAVLGETSSVEDCGDHLVISTPSRPGFYWGNFLLLHDAPNSTEVIRWLARFEEAFPAADFGHIAIGWQEDNRAAADPFLARGMHPEMCHVSTSSDVPSPAFPCEGLKIAPVVSDRDWKDAERLSASERDPIHEPAGFARFIRAQFQARRKQVELGKMTWFLARLGGVAVGSMGLFVDGGIGRYQDVVTHSDYRRKGICGTLLCEVARYGLQELGAKTLVLLADVDGSAWRIYKSHGFVASDMVCGVWRPPQER